MLRRIRGLFERCLRRWLSRWLVLVRKAVDLSPMVKICAGGFNDKEINSTYERPIKCEWFGELLKRRPQTKSLGLVITGQNCNTRRSNCLLDAGLG